MKKVLLAVGHQNCEQLTGEALRSWRDVAYLRTSTGAGGERDWHAILAPLLADLLTKAGVQVTITDSVYHKEVYEQEYDLFATLHYDGGGVENRCMISAPLTGQGYLHDGAQAEAERFCNIWREIYPKETGAINRDERITAGMRENYMFDYAPMDTPSVIIEHFNQSSAMGKNLKDDPAKVARADFMAIANFLKLNVDVPPVGAIRDIVIDWDDFEGKRHTVGWYVYEWMVEKKKNAGIVEMYEEQLSDKQKTITTVNKKLDEATQTIEDKERIITEKERKIAELLEGMVDDDALIEAQHTIVTLNEKLDTATNIITAKENVITEKEVKIHTLETDLKKANDTIARLQAGILEPLNIGQIFMLIFNWIRKK